MEELQLSSSSEATLDQDAWGRDPAFRSLRLQGPGRLPKPPEGPAVDVNLAACGLPWPRESTPLPGLSGPPAHLPGFRLKCPPTHMAQGSHRCQSTPHTPQHSWGDQRQGGGEHAGMVNVPAPSPPPALVHPPSRLAVSTHWALGRRGGQTDKLPQPRREEDTHSSVDRDRMADRVSRMHPKGPASNWEEEKGMSAHQARTSLLSPPSSHFPPLTSLGPQPREQPAPKPAAPSPARSWLGGP